MGTRIALPTQGEKKESELCELVGCTESIYGKAEYVLEIGQKEAESQNHNGSQKTSFKNSRDPHLEPTGPNPDLGLTIHTEGAVLNCEGEKHQEQVAETGSDFKVYVRARGCRKKVAQPSRTEYLPVKTKATHPQKQP